MICQRHLTIKNFAQAAGNTTAKNSTEKTGTKLSRTLFQAL